MSYELSFSQNFFCQEEFDTENPPPPSDRPTSVLQALISMEEEEYEEMSMSLFSCENACLEDVILQIRDTNTCSNLNSPVEVWIDEDGDYTIFVYDDENDIDNETIVDVTNLSDFLGADVEISDLDYLD